MTRGIGGGGGVGGGEKGHQDGKKRDGESVM